MIRMVCDGCKTAHIPADNAKYYGWLIIDKMNGGYGNEIRARQLHICAGCAAKILRASFGDDILRERGPGESRFPKEAGK